MRVFILNNYFIGALPDDAKEITALPPVDGSNCRWDGAQWVRSQQVYILPDGTFFGTFDATANPAAELPDVFKQVGATPIEAPIPDTIMRWDGVSWQTIEQEEQ